jgi:hypothetical protein
MRMHKILLLENLNKTGLDSTGSEWGPVAGFHEHGTELSGSIKGGKFLD